MIFHLVSLTLYLLYKTLLGFFVTIWIGVVLWIFRHLVYAAVITIAAFPVRAINSILTLLDTGYFRIGQWPMNSDFALQMIDG